MRTPTAPVRVLSRALCNLCPRAQTTKARGRENGHAKISEEQTEERPAERAARENQKAESVCGVLSKVGIRTESCVQMPGTK